METVLLLQKGEGRRNQQGRIEERVKESGFEFAILELEEKRKDFVFQIEQWISENKKPVATLRWDEHGNVFGKHPAFKEIAEWGWETKVAPLNIDFGYFSHYGSLMFDLLDKSGRHSIKREWRQIDDEMITLEEFPGKLKNYITLVKTVHQKHQYFYGMKHITASYEFAVFTQCLANNCNIMKSNNAFHWMQNVRLSLGAAALFKIQPSIFNDKEINLSGFRTVFSGGNPRILNQSIEQNACIATPAGACITNTSGVTSELLLGERQVVTTGESWFSGLDVFHEVSDWQHLAETAKGCSGRPISAKQATSRLKFANWWRKHQVMEGEESSLVKNLINEFKEES